MKRLLLFLLLSPLFSLGQDTTWTFTKIVKLDSISQSTIFNVANEWFVNKRLTNNNKFILEKTTGKMTGAGSFPVVIKGGIAGKDKGIVIFSFVFIARDGKCKFELSDFEHILIMASGGNLKNETPKCGHFSLSQKSWIEIKALSKEYANALIWDLENTLLKLKKVDDF